MSARVARHGIPSRGLEALFPSSASEQQFVLPRHHRIGNLSHLVGELFDLKVFRTLIFPKAIIVGGGGGDYRCLPLTAEGCGECLFSCCVTWTGHGQRHSALCWRWRKPHPLVSLCQAFKVCEYRCLHVCVCVCDPTPSSLFCRCVRVLRLHRRDDLRALPGRLLRQRFDRHAR